MKAIRRSKRKSLDAGASLKTFFQCAITLIGAYFIAWTVSYVVITERLIGRLDFTEYFEWLVLTWTFHGLELVRYTWFFSLVGFLPLAVVMIFLVKRLGRRG